MTEASLTKDILGLSFQLRGQKIANSRSSDLRKALSLYKMALRFFLGMSGHEEEQSTLLQLALYNNMAHIHLEQHDNDAFDRQVSRMNEVLLQGRCSWDEEEQGFFALNLVVSDQTNCVRVAPAA